MKKIQNGDQVVVIAGRSRGVKGKVNKLMADGRYIVQGVNIIKKHTKPNPQANQPGGIIEKEAPISPSNVAILNPKTQKADRVGIRIDESGKKMRFYKSDGAVIKN